MVYSVSSSCLFLVNRLHRGISFHFKALGLVVAIKGIVYISQTACMGIFTYVMESHINCIFIDRSKSSIWIILLKVIVIRLTI